MVFLIKKRNLSAGGTISGNGYSINLPAEYDLSGKLRKS